MEPAGVGFQLGQLLIQALARECAEPVAGKRSILVFVQYRNSSLVTGIKPVAYRHCLEVLNYSFF
jgi:hypothetical protein